MKRIFFGLVLFPVLALASLPRDGGAYAPQVIRASDPRELEPGLAHRLAGIYAGLKGPETPAGKTVPAGPLIPLQLIGYLTATIVVENIRVDSGKPSAITVTGTVEGEERSRVQLVLIGDALVGSVQLEAGETYLIESRSPGRYVVNELKAAWQVSAQADAE